MSLSGSTPAWLTDDWMCCARRAYHTCSTLRANAGIVVVEANTTSGCFRSKVLWRTQGPLLGFHCIRRKKSVFQRSIVLDALTALERRLGCNFVLIRSWHSVGRQQVVLPSQHNTWRGIYYSRREPYKLALERIPERESFCPRSTSS